MGSFARLGWPQQTVQMRVVLSTDIHEVGRGIAIGRESLAAPRVVGVHLFCPRHKAVPLEELGLIVMDTCLGVPGCLIY